MMNLVTVTAEDLKQEMIALLRSKFPEWTDQQESNNMIVFLGIIASLAELNYAYLNVQAREAFLKYAQDPRNVEAHAWARNYTPRYQTAATIVADSITSDRAVTANTTLPVGTKVATALAGVYYETTAAATILSGQTSVANVPMAQHESHETSFTGSGAVRQKVYLTQSPVIPSTVAVTIAGETWTKVDTFIESGPASLHYCVVTDVEGVSTVLFGDGVLGKAPLQGAAGLVTYKTGGGVQNTIGPNQLMQVVTEVRDGGNNQLLSLVAFNSVAAEPGTDKETLEQIRMNARQNLVAPKTLLTKDDVKYAVLGTPGVSTCRVVNWQDNPALPSYLLQIFVKPTANTAIPAGLRTSLNQLLTVDKPVVMNHIPVLMDATYKTLNFDVSVAVDTRYSEAAVLTGVQQCIVDLLDGKYPAWFVPDFASVIYPTRFAAAIQSLVPGVLYLVVNLPGVTQCNYTEYPVVGAIAVRTTFDDPNLIIPGMSSLNTDWSQQ